MIERRSLILSSLAALGAKTLGVGSAEARTGKVGQRLLEGNELNTIRFQQLNKMFSHNPAHKDKNLMKLWLLPNWQSDRAREGQFQVCVRKLNPVQIQIIHKSNVMMVTPDGISGDTSDLADKALQFQPYIDSKGRLDYKSGIGSASFVDHCDPLLTS